MDFTQLEAFLTAHTKKQGGVSGEQAAALSRFWKNHKPKIRDGLVQQSRWESSLRGLSWRADLQTQSRHAERIGSPVALVELELGRTGQESEFVCLEFDEAKVNHVLKKMAEIEESINAITHSS